MEKLHIKFGELEGFSAERIGKEGWKWNENILHFKKKKRPKNLFGQVGEVMGVARQMGKGFLKDKNFIINNKKKGKNEEPNSTPSKKTINRGG